LKEHSANEAQTQTPEQSGRRLMMTRVSFLSFGFTLALTAAYLMLQQAAFHSAYGLNTRYVVVERD